MDDKTIKLSPNKQKKSAIVARIAEKAAKAKAIVFTNYQGLTHRQLEQFKKEIKKSDAFFEVTKNTLLKLALEQSQKSKVPAERDRASLDKSQNQEEDFTGQTGTLFLNGDIVAPLKALAKMIKELQKPEIKFGLLEGNALTAEEIKKLATLPAREQLIAQLLGVMKSPVFGLHKALNWNTQRFVLTLNAISKAKASRGVSRSEIGLRWT